MRARRARCRLDGAEETLHRSRSISPPVRGCGFGCRFLRLDHRTLLANAPPADVLVRLRTGKSDDLEKDLAHVEGLFLRGRTLRFADFTESRLYAADLMEADLRGGLLEGCRCRART